MHIPFVFRIYQIAGILIACYNGDIKLCQKKAKADKKGYGEIKGEQRGGNVGEGGKCQLLYGFCIFHLYPRSVPLVRGTVRVRASK